MNESKLKKLVNSGKSLNEISKICGKSYTTIRYWLRKYKLKSRWSGFLQTKHTNEELLTTAKESLNYTNFLMKICRKNSGGAWYHYKNRLKKLGFDFSIFEENSGGKVTAKKKNIEALKSKRRLRRKILNTLLKHNNIEYKCSNCGISEWLGKKLLLPIHHKDDNPAHNTLDNLCYLCPNCHNIQHYDDGKRLLN